MTKCLLAAALLLATAACRSQTADNAVRDEGSCPAGYALPGWSDPTHAIDDASVTAAVNAYGASITFQDEPGQGDYRKLTVMSGGTGSLGPLARLQASCGVHRITDATLRSGVIIARIVDEGPGDYPKLALKNGVTTWVAVRADAASPSGYSIHFLPTNRGSASPSRDYPMPLDHAPGPHHPHNWKQELARFVFSATDEALWVTCGATHCCYVEPY